MLHITLKSFTIEKEVYMDAKNHWEKVYQEKNEQDVSWFQENPIKSLELIAECNLQPNDGIIDIGGGDSHLVDHLLANGFLNVSVLDISQAALEKAKIRLGERASSVKFIASDVTKFKPSEKYRLWHDRAAFHFLTNIQDIEAYLSIANEAIAPDGFLIVSTFSKSGPEKCSGLPVTQYSDVDLKMLFQKYFVNTRCFEDTHHTPWNSSQNFVYCGFKKRK